MIRRNSTTSWLALAAFLVHAVLGCCAHHAHAAPHGAHAGDPCMNSVAGTECGHSEDDHASDEQHSQQPICDSEDCTYDVAAKVKLPASGTSATVFLIEDASMVSRGVERLSQTAPLFQFGACPRSGARPLLQIWQL